MSEQRHRRLLEPRVNPTSGSATYSTTRNYPPLLRRVAPPQPSVATAGEDEADEASPEPGFSKQESPTLSLSKPILTLLAQGTVRADPEVSVALPDPEPEPEPDATVIVQIPAAERAASWERSRDTRPPARPRLLELVPESPRPSRTRPLIWIAALLLVGSAMGLSWATLHNRETVGPAEFNHSGR